MHKNTDLFLPIFSPVICEIWTAWTDYKRRACVYVWCVCVRVRVWLMHVARVRGVRVYMMYCSLCVYVVYVLCVVYVYVTHMTHKKTLY